MLKRAVVLLARLANLLHEPILAVSLSSIPTRASGAVRCTIKQSCGEDACEAAF